MSKLSPIFLFILLIVFPAGSYLYLKFGFDYRKEALARLVPKENFFDNHPSTKDEIGEGNTSLLINTHRCDQSLLKKHFRHIHNQFNKSFSFQSIFFVDSNYQELKLENTKHILSRDIFDFDYALMDTSNQIRQYYVLKQESDFKEIVEDLAIILPSVAGKDISEKKYE